MICCCIVAAAAIRLSTNKALYSDGFRFCTISLLLALRVGRLLIVNVLVHVVKNREIFQGFFFRCQKTKFWIFYFHLWNKSYELQWATLRVMKMLFNIYSNSLRLETELQMSYASAAARVFPVHVVLRKRWQMLAVEFNQPDERNIFSLQHLCFLYGGFNAIFAHWKREICVKLSRVKTESFKNILLKQKCVASIIKKNKLLDCHE